jgi:hypothetical protein
VRYGDYEQQRYGERGNCGQKDRRLTSPEDTSAVPTVADWTWRGA